MTDDCGSSTDTVDVTVAETENDVPVAIAGPDQILPEGTTSAVLDGSGSYDPDGGPAVLSYTWTQTAGPTLGISSMTAVSPTVAGISDGHSYSFELVVFDGQDSSFPSSVTLYGDSIFIDGFESGGTTNWSSVVGVAFRIATSRLGPDHLREGGSAEIAQSIPLLLPGNSCTLAEDVAKTTGRAGSSLERAFDVASGGWRFDSLLALQKRGCSYVLDR